jgi:Zn-dependent peptidase ImmA (M78 family)
MTPRQRTRIKAEVAGLLAMPVAARRPVPVDQIARQLGIRLAYLPFDSEGEELSGFYQRRGADQIIGVNSSQARVRQRFTAAHELGHARLQQGDGIHIDQAFMLRDARSGEASDPHEIAANAFAAELLMPEEEVVAALVGGRFDITDDSGVRGLARQFGVSLQSVTYRLANLGWRIDGNPRFG